MFIKANQLWRANVILVVRAIHILRNTLSKIFSPLHPFKFYAFFGAIS